MELRIAFCGASGTGKSTIATWLAEHLHLPFCDVGSREIAAKMGFASPYDVDRAGMRGAFQRKLFAAKRSWEEQHTSFVTDRTHLDNLAYTRIHSPEVANKEYERACIEASARYTHVVVCPTYSFHEIGADPARVRDRDYHQRYEDDLLLLLRLLPSSVQRRTLSATDLAQRKQDVLDLLRSEAATATL